MPTGSQIVLQDNPITGYGQISEQPVIIFEQVTHSTGSGGEANTSSNAGTVTDGEGLALPKAGIDLPFRRVKAGIGLTSATSANSVLLGVNVGTGALQIVQLDASAKLPPVDGSQLTGIVGGVSSVNAKTGSVVLVQDDVLAGALFTQYSKTEKTKLSAIEPSAISKATADGYYDPLGSASAVSSALGTHASLTVTAHGGIVSASDPRLTDSRPPTAHSSTHTTLGSDPLVLSEGQITNLITDLASKVPTTRMINGVALGTDVTLTQDNIGDGSTYKQYSSTDKAKVGSITMLGSLNVAAAATVSGNNTGDQDLSGYVGTSRTINGHNLSANFTLTATDIAAVTNKNYVTDAQLTLLGSTSGVNTGDVSLATNSGQTLTGQVLALGTPTVITSGSSNAVSGNTHSHSVGTGIYVVGGTDVAVTDGGTGASTGSGALNNLIGASNAGDMLYYDGSQWQKLAAGTTGQVLKSQGATAPLWGSVGGGGDTLAPATNSADYVPMWNGTNSKTLKNGLAVGTLALNLVQLDGSAKLPAIDGSQLTGIAGGVSSVNSKTGSVSLVQDDIPAGTVYTRYSLTEQSKLSGIQPSAISKATADGYYDVLGAAATVSSALSTHTGLTTTAHGGIVASNDSRLTDNRYPTVHSASHASGATDALVLAQSQITNLVTDLAGKVGTTRTINGHDLSANFTLTATDIAAVTNKNYVTDAQLTVLGSTSGVNTGDVSLATTSGLALTGQVLTLGTPSVITAGSTSSLTSNSHTHAVGTGIYIVGGTDVAIADGGTGASTASGAFNNLTGSNVQGDILYYDGSQWSHLAAGTSGWVLKTNGAGANPGWVAQTGGGGGGLTWSTVTTNTNMATQNAYVVNGSSLVTMLLPSSAPVGAQVQVTGLGTGGWEITQGAGQTIIVPGVDNDQTKIGANGYVLCGNQYDDVSLVCVTQDTTWKIICMRTKGSLTIGT